MYKLLLKLIYILWLLSLLACESTEIIADNLSQHDANEIIVILQEHNIKAKKISETNKKNINFHIQTTKKDSLEALRILVYYKLPKNYRAGLKEVYPPGSAGLIPSKSDELARFTMAQQGEIESLLRVLPGIIDARVMLSDDKNSSDKLSNKSASVAIIYRSNINNNNLNNIINTEEIRKLVAAAVNMSPELVQVVMKEQPDLGLSSLSQPKPSSNLSQADSSLSQAELISNLSQADYSLSQGEARTKPEAQASYLSWVLLGMTMLALLLAAYAFWRPRLLMRLNQSSKQG